MTRSTFRIETPFTRPRSFMPQPVKHPVSGIYYTRRRVPDDLRDALGREYKKSLGTRDPAEAKRRHVVELANADTKFALARMQAQGKQRLGGTDAVILAGHWYRIELEKMEQSLRFEQWLATGAPYISEGPDHYEEHERWVTLRESSEEDGDFSLAEAAAVRNMRRTLADQKLPVPEQASDLYRLLVKTFLDHLFLLSDVALARRNGDWATRPETVSSPLSINKAKAKTEQRTLMQVFADYEEDRKITSQSARGTLSTLAEYRALMGEFVELLDDQTISSIDRQVVARYRTEISRLPSKGEGLRGLTAKAKIELADAQGLPRISAGTVSNKLRALSSVLGFALRLQYVPENPVVAGGFLREAAKAQRLSRAAIRTRKHYSADELQAIFTSPIYAISGWAPPRASFGAAWYWIPLLLYYTGARLEEVAQLKKEDVCVGADGPYLGILNVEGANDGGRGVKNSGSRRDIPLHPDLISLGFMTYVEALPAGQVFPGLSPDRKGYFSTNFGKRWKCYLVDDAKVLSPASPAHGFRHSFKTLWREVGLAEDVGDAITGHSGGNAVARGYGVMPLSVKIAAMQRFPSAPGLSCLR